MDIQTLTRFFMWGTIINGTLLVFWTLISLISPNLLYRSQKMFFSISQETFNIVIYSLLGLFKLLFLVFNLVPFLALLIIS